MTETLRKPAIFSVDDPRLVVAEPEEVPEPAMASAEAPAGNLPAVTAPPQAADALGHAVLVGAVRPCAAGAWASPSPTWSRTCIARAPWLGAIGLALALLAGLALLVVMLREIVGLARLSTVEALRHRALSDHRKRRPRPRAARWSPTCCR